MSNKKDKKGLAGLAGRLFGGNGETKSNEQETSALQQQDKQPVTDHESTTESVNDERVDNIQAQQANQPLPTVVKKPINSFSAALEENNRKRAEHNQRVLAQAKERYNGREEQTDLMTRSSGGQRKD